MILQTWCRNSRIIKCWILCIAWQMWTWNSNTYSMVWKTELKGGENECASLQLDLQYSNKKKRLYQLPISIKPANIIKTQNTKQIRKVMLNYRKDIWQWALVLRKISTSLLLRRTICMNIYVVIKAHVDDCGHSTGQRFVRTLTRRTQVEERPTRPSETLGWHEQLPLLRTQHQPDRQQTREEPMRPEAAYLTRPRRCQIFFQRGKASKWSQIQKVQNVVS